MPKIPKASISICSKSNHCAHLATVMPDGSSQVTPMWVDYDGDYVVINTARGWVKDRNMLLGAIEIMDADNPYRYI